MPFLELSAAVSLKCPLLPPLFLVFSSRSLLIKPLPFQLSPLCHRHDSMLATCRTTIPTFPRRPPSPRFPLANPR